ncbi:MAG: enoyl-CoA hydratase [Halieaceae bacterium]|jgi:enoyl-CoA hydratase
MSDAYRLFLDPQEVPDEPGWLQRQPMPVLAMGEGGHSQNADVVLQETADIDLLRSRIERNPVAAMTLVQVLRAVEQLPVETGITVESLAYATLQAGKEYRLWLESREEAPRLIAGGDGEPIILERSGNTVTAVLNRPGNRNSLTVEMRDALVELFDLVLLDDSITRLHLSGSGGCFSIGGELREFGLAEDPAAAHWIRSTHNPGRLLARCAQKVSCHIHSASLGSGIELPAFAHHISADPGSFFQLPELTFGLIPGAGGCVSISRRIGRQRTAWMALSGKKINSSTALAWGLIDELKTSD